VTNRLGIHGPLIRSEVHCKSLFIIPDFVLTLDRTHPNVMTTQSPALTADSAVLAQATLPPTTVASSGMDVDPPALGSMDCTGVEGVDTSEPHPGAVQPPRQFPAAILMKSTSLTSIWTLRLHQQQYRRLRLGTKPTQQSRCQQLQQLRLPRLCH
jgi:hypothetical protein